MKILYYDCFSGISGDMNLGALVDLGVDRKYLQDQLNKLNIDVDFELCFRRETRKGITGTRVEIKIDEKNKKENNEISNVNIHDDIHNKNNDNLYHHKHEFNKDFIHDKIHDNSHELMHRFARNLPSIKKIISESDLSPAVKSRSLSMFEMLAQAEGRVHGISKDEVHFHEVGAFDAILDIVGAAVCLEYLQVDKILSSSVELGGGFVSCAHGILPVPAPAVVQLLQGVPVKSGIVKFETTTPTGAVILAANVQEFTDCPQFMIEKVGYGIGKRDLEIPNVLRVYLGSSEDESNSRIEKTDRNEYYLLETNLDDMNPEYFDFVEERLYEAGAVDVFKIPIIMKKSRPGIILSILTPKERVATLEEIIYQETTTIGLRKYPVEKSMIPRTSKVLETKYGPVKVKYSYHKGQLLKAKPEYEDLKKIARQKGIALPQIYQEISHLIYEESNTNKE